MMTQLSNRITAYILKRTTTTLTELEGVVVSAGFTLDDLYQALETVHKDKRITVANLASGVTYKPATAKPAPSTSHLTWLRSADTDGKPNYPPMTPETDGSGIDIDLGFLFLKTKEERDEYQAAVKGVPKYMLQSKRHGNTRG